MILERILCACSFFPGSLRPLNTITLQFQVYLIWCLMHLTTGPEQLKYLAEMSALLAGTTPSQDAPHGLYDSTQGSVWEQCSAGLVQGG